MPVVAVSASVMPNDQQRIMASGFDAYVMKPISVKSFVETVEKFAGKPKG
jgi:two-component system cell cycle response regulator DivK